MRKFGGLVMPVVAFVSDFDGEFAISDALPNFVVKFLYGHGVALGIAAVGLYTQFIQA